LNSNHEETFKKNNLLNIRRLNVIALGFEPRTAFKLYQNYSVIDGVIQGNSDTITITYNSESLYISRACGFKNVFTIQSFEIQSDLDQWMIVSSISINEIVSQNETNVEILH
jgi:hypothetical protein